MFLHPTPEIDIQGLKTQRQIFVFPLPPSCKEEQARVSLTQSHFNQKIMLSMGALPGLCPCPRPCPQAATTPSHEGHTPRLFLDV